MGIIKYQLKNIPIDVEKVEDISFPSLRTGSLQFTVFIQVRTYLSIFFLSFFILFLLFYLFLVINSIEINNKI